MEITGKIIAVLPVQGGTSKNGNEWKKQEYVLETHDQYPKKVCFQIFGADRIEQEALAARVPIIRRETAALLKTLVAAKAPRAILEIGTAVGYSALLMARVMPADCRITTIEKYEKRIPIARENFRLAGEEERIALLDKSYWRNLRVPIRFASFIYPLPGAQWQGRRAISSIDLSCGGVAFYCAPTLQVGDCCEIVIPVTVQPVILKCQILRRNDLSGERCLYAAKFIEMCHAEETFVREAVFRVQLRSRPRKDSANENTKGEQV